MTRFVFVVWGLVPGGTHGVLRHVWAKLGDHAEISIVSHGPDRLPAPYPVRVAGSRFSHPLSFPGVWLYVARMTAACVAEVRRRRPAVLLPQDSLATGAAAVLAGLLTRVPVVVMEHGTAVVVRGEYFWSERVGRRRLHRLRLPLLRASVRFLHWFCLRFARGALIPGDEAVPIYRAAGMRAERVLRYHIPVDLERLQPASDEERRAARSRLGLSRGSVVAASISRLTPEKGIELMLRALAAMPEAGRPELVIAGDGPLRGALESAASALGLQPRFAGNLEPAGVADLLAASDLFLYAGLEGTNTPVAVLEAMAAGLPVIGSWEPCSLLELLADGRGAAVPPGDVAAMAAEIARFAGDAELRRRAGSLARRLVEERHSPAAFGAEFDRFLGWFGLAG